MLPRALIALAIPGVAILACGPLPAQAPPAPVAPRIAIIAAERSGPAIRLVAVDEHGDRQVELLAPAAGAARDTHPAVSPDGRWLVFASSRGRPLDETRLWIARLGAGAAPRPLTGLPGESIDPRDGGKSPAWADPRDATHGGPLWINPRDATRGGVNAPAVPAQRGREGPLWIDAHPAWLPDGSAIVFASTRDGGDYDLWRLAIDRVTGAPGALTELTHGAGHEVTPAIAPDGAIVYTAVTPDPVSHQVETHLEERAPDGTIRVITRGPADSSPAISPDGRWLVFSRPAFHGGTPDAELWRMARASARSSIDEDLGDDAQPLVELPLTDESGPVWSRDGRFVFATSVVRGADGHVVFSSIIHVDLRAARPVARMLEDRVGAIVRLTPAMTATPLDAAALDRDPAYLPELARAMSQLIDRATDQAH